MVPTYRFGLTKPRFQEKSFELWTLARLQTEYEERYGLRLGISTIFSGCNRKVGVEATAELVLGCR